MNTTDQPDILLVGDIVDDGPNRATVFDWDNPTWGEVETLLGWLARNGRRSEVVPRISDFINSAASHRGKLIFPLWRGGQSRSRTAIVPGVCEAIGLPWVGADAFVQSVCQDKSLSKHYLRIAGIDCPQDVVIYSSPLSAESIQAMQNLHYPAVAKPLFSACSIGVEASSLCGNYSALLNRVKELIEQGLGPVICEPFIAGEEVSLCLVENGRDIVMRCVAAYLGETDKCPFNNRLITFEDKTAAHRNWRIGCYRDSDPFDGIWSKINVLISMLGPFNLLRVDGRISNGHFTAIELTPDIHLGLDSAFLGAFNSAGIPPEHVLAAIIGASLASRPLSGRSRAEQRQTEA